MIRPLGDPLSPAALTSYLEGELPPDDRAKIEQALATSPEGRRRLEGLRQVHEALVARDPDLEALDLTGPIRAAIARPVAKPRPAAVPRGRWTWALLAASFAAAAVLIVARLPRPGTGGLSLAPPPEDLPVAKAAGAADEADRWAGLQVYREPRGAEAAAVPVTDVLPSGAGLLFTYTNLGPHPYDRLMIFARDASGEVRWFFPIYASAADDPTSIPIRAGAADVSLGQVVRQPLHPGPLTIHALFSRHPLHVREVEGWLARSPGAVSAGALPWADAHLIRRSASVAPEAP